MSDYDKYYAEQLEEGEKFQDFLTNKLPRYGIKISNYSSREYQYEHGENKEGIEIKLDKKYKETGNLYIEVAEKSHPNNPVYVKSGIYKKNAQYFITGDYHKIYMFSIKALRHINKSNKHKTVKTDTSKGFLLPKEKAEYWAIRIIDLNIS